MSYLHPHAAPFRYESHTTDEVLFLHGWTGSPAHLRPLGRMLADAGFPVTAPLLAGHGTTERDMADTTWHDWVRSAGEAAQDIIDRGHRLHLAGLSMGGVIALLMAPVFDAASLTTINAPIRVHDWRVRFAWLMRGSKRITELPDDPAPPPDTAEFWQDYRDRPLGTIADLFDLVRAARRNLGAVNSPTLVVQSHSDETVRPESARIIYDGVSSARKRLLWLQESRHVATLDTERHAIAEAMIELLSSTAADAHEK